MRDEKEVQAARYKLMIEIEKLSKQRNPSARQVAQLACLSGMSVALQWVAKEGGQTLQDLLDGREIE